MKKAVLLFVALMAFGLQHVQAQDAPLKIVTNHPDFKVKVQRCAASGKTVILDLLFTNESVNDVENVDVLGSPYGSEAYDDQGNIYQHQTIMVKVANREGYNNSTSPFSILTGVPMKVSVRIDKVPAAAQSIARLKLCVTCKAWNLSHEKPVVFRNIPISRD